MKFSEVQVGQAYMVKAGRPRLVQSLTRYGQHEVYESSSRGIGYFTKKYREDAKGMYVKVHAFNDWEVENDGADMVADDLSFDFVRITQFEMTWNDYKIKVARELEAVVRREQYSTDKRILQKTVSDEMKEITGRWFSSYSPFDDTPSLHLLLKVLDAVKNNPDTLAQIKEYVARMSD
jgi:hypothetical protein